MLNKAVGFVLLPLPEQSGAYTYSIKPVSFGFHHCLK